MGIFREHLFRKHTRLQRVLNGEQIPLLHQCFDALKVDLQGDIDLVISCPFACTKRIDWPISHCHGCRYPYWSLIDNLCILRRIILKVFSWISLNPPVPSDDLDILQQIPVPHLQILGGLPDRSGAASFSGKGISILHNHFNAACRHFGRKAEEPAFSDNALSNSFLR